MHSSKYFTNEQLVTAVTQNNTMAQTLQQLNMPKTSGNYAMIKKHILLLNLDTSHWEVYKPKFQTFKTKIPLDLILTTNSTYSRQHLKERLIKEKYLEYKCYFCDIIDWCNKPISLQLEHINGISNDNRLANLKLLCPNCHSQTNTYAGKANKNRGNLRYRKKCIDCNLPMKRGKANRQRCLNCHRNSVKSP